MPSTTSSEGRSRACGKIRMRACPRFRARFSTVAAACVRCHNTHPDSPKRDWQVGDVRGIEEFIISQPIGSHIFAFKYLLLYFAFVAVSGLAFIGLQRYQSSVIARFNKELARSNE